MSNKPAWQLALDEYSQEKGLTKKEATKPKKKSEKKAEVKEESGFLDFMKSLASGAGRGVTGIAGIGGDIQTMIDAAQQSFLRERQRTGDRSFELFGVDPTGGKGVDYAKPRAEGQKLDTLLPTSQQVFEGIEGATGLEGTLTYQPKTSLGKIAQTAGEFSAGGAIGSAPVKGALMYGGIGAGAETAGLLNEGVGTAIGTVGSLAAGKVASGRRGVEKVLPDIIGTQSPDALQKAKALEAASKKAGIPLTAAETLDSPALQTLATQVAGSSAGADILQPFAKQRGEQIKQSLLGLPAKATEAPDVMPSQLQREASEAAGSAVSKTYQERTGAVTDLYETAKTQELEPSIISDLIKEARAAKKGVGQDTKNAIDKFISRLTRDTTKTTDGKRKKVKAPVVKVGQLDDEYKTLRDLMQEKKNAGQTTIAANMQPLLQKLKDATGTNENIKEARAIFQEMTPQIETIVKDSGLDAIAKSKTIDSVVDIITNPAKANAESIGIVASKLNKEDVTVFPKIARHWLDKTIDQTLVQTSKGEQSASAGVNFVNSIRGVKGTDRSKVLNSVLEGIADANGKDAIQFKTGFNAMLDILERTNIVDRFAQPKAKAGQIASQVEGAKPVGSGLLGADVLRPLAPMARTARDMAVNKSYKQIARALVSDNSIDAIMQLSQKNVSDRVKQNIVANIVNSAREQGSLLRDDIPRVDITLDDRQQSLLGQ